MRELIVDSFAGGGGASTGIELATGRTVDIAINHDPDAILMHRTNHPFTTHYQESVWDVDPREVCGGQPVGLAWFSPDCKHFSKAKGSSLVDRNIRGLAWVVLRWAGTVRPRVIILENVEEFQTWGPVRKGKPVKKKSGETFRQWLSQLEALGYQVDFRELVAADYGAPTTRKRFVLVARCDGRPIVWPQPTHAPADSPEVRDGERLPWRSAAEIIDWKLPAYSIFASRAEIKEQYGVNAVRPLADNTLRRIIRGVDKFTIRSGNPFLVPNKSGITTSQIIQYHTEQTEGMRGQDLDHPLQTIDSSNRYGLTLAYLTEYYGNGQPVDIRDPMRTVTSHDREAIIAVHTDKYFAGGYKGYGNGADEPLTTITVKARQSLVTVDCVKANKFRDYGYWPQIRELLNQYCGYNIIEDEILLLYIGGVAYFIRDISLRMFSPRELYNSMGFPPDYIIGHDYRGNQYGKTKQIARCGNAVCPPLAEAMVRANLPEWSCEKISTMRDLHDMIRKGA